MSTVAERGVTSRRVPPGPPRRETLSLLRRLAADRLGLMTAARDEYGDAVRVAIGPKVLYIFNHPDHAKRKQRRTIQPVFQNKRVAAQAGVIAAEGTRLIDRPRTHVGGPPVDILHELTGLTLAVLGMALLDADLGAFAAIGDRFESVQDQAMFEMQTLGMVPMWLPLPHRRRLRRARKDLGDVVDQLVEERLAGPRADGDDVLTRRAIRWWPSRCSPSGSEGAYQ